MPIYEYVCTDCGEEFEALIRGDQQPACPSCGQKNLQKNISAPAAHSAGSTTPECPVQDSCGADPCCGSDCGMGQWTS
jgi:putative FmdB family regulatory protein